jgi:hypothetical protein
MRTIDRPGSFKRDYRREPTSAGEVLEVKVESALRGIHALANLLDPRIFAKAHLAEWGQTDKNRPDVSLLETAVCHHPSTRHEKRCMRGRIDSRVRAPRCQHRATAAGLNG